jgi:hypothetical protein
MSIDDTGGEVLYLIMTEGKEGTGGRKEGRNHGIMGSSSGISPRTDHGYPVC